MIPDFLLENIIGTMEIRKAVTLPYIIVEIMLVQMVTEII